MKSTGSSSKAFGKPPQPAKYEIFNNANRKKTSEMLEEETKKMVCSIGVDRIIGRKVKGVAESNDKGEIEGGV